MTPGAPSRSQPATPRSRAPSVSYRFAVASRALAAIGGGYALAAFTNTALALIIRTPREEAVMISTMPSFLLFAGGVIWAFSASTAWRAWAGIGLPTLVAAALTWWLQKGVAS